MGPTLGQLGVGAPLNLNNPLAMNPALTNPLLALNPQLLALLSNPLLSQGLTGLANPAAQQDQNAVLSQMSQLAQLLQGGNTGLNLGYGSGSTQNQPLQNPGQVNLDSPVLCRKIIPALGSY